LPDFHVNSIFEEHPEQKITLRMLLSHTAGFAQEAPLGGNFDQPRATFEQHIASISDTWLMFPVGTRYSYSNLGIDLAGYILQVRSGMPFHQYVKEKVFDPLGMTGSTLDFDIVHATPDRAIGHNPLYLGPLSPRSDWAIIPSGGVWASASDMARYLRFHIDKGSLDGTRLLREELAETMYTPPNRAARLAEYALGIAVLDGYNTREFQHGGGGFGFNSNMAWFPELKLGVVVLTNAEHRDLISQLPEEILMKIVSADLPLYRERGRPFTPTKPALVLLSQPEALSDLALAKLIAGHALPDDPAAIQRRRGYVGAYIFSRWGIPVASAELKDIDGQLSFSNQEGTSSLVEVQPGLFFDLHGTAVDLRSSDPTVGNIHLTRVNEAARSARILLYSLCALIFLSAVFYWPAQALVRRDRRKKGLPDVPPGRTLGWAALLAALAGLIDLICLVAIARFPLLIDVPWPVPYPELRWWQFAGMSLPYAALVLAAGAAFLTGLAWKNGLGGREIRVFYTVTILALLAFNFAILL
jgi:CubicO group peptidase (beta-lactamase class C family)